MPEIKSKYPGKCRVCKRAWKKGDTIWYNGKASCLGCKTKTESRRYRVVGTQYELRFDYNANIVQDIKALSGKWSPGKKTWTVPATEAATSYLVKMNFEQIQDTINQEHKINLNKTLKISEKPKVEGFDMLMRHQVQAVNTFIEGHRKLYIGAVPGSGKTLISLASVEKTKTYPLLIVCPSIVKLNWQNEIKKWLGKDSEILSTRSPYKFKSKIVIINYDILDAWKDKLTGFETIIFDESHYIKEQSAKRTKAAIKVSTGVENILHLSGTPVPKSPYDLCVPLHTMGMLKRFGSKKAYINRYCPPQQTRYGVQHNKTKNLSELHTNLKNICFMGWDRHDILDLPDIQHIDIPVETKTHSFDELVAAMKDDSLLEAYRVMHDLGDVQMSNQFAKARSESGKQKIQSIIDQAKELAEYEQVVVGVYHRDVNNEVVKKLKKNFKVSQIIGGKNNQKDIDDFTSGKTQIMVMSTTAGGIGINLFNSSKFIFGELPVSSSEYEQAYARVYRQGQTSNVTVYRILGIGGIDDLLVSIINRKAAMASAVIDGQEIETENIKEMLAKYLANLKTQTLN